MMKPERLAKRSSFGNMVRKRLSDISNLQTQPKLVSLEDKPLQCSPSSIDYIEKLFQENKTLMELAEERNKIIASSAAELQKLRTNYQKLQQQNWNLAQSNSHYLAELNMGRDKLKALQHELVCKDTLLKAKKLEAKVDMNVTNEPLLQTNVDDEKHSSRSQRRISRRQSLGSTTKQQERIENKRRCLRRQTHNLKPVKDEVSENLFEIDDTRFDINKPCDSPAPRTEAQASQRASIGRPLRRAVEKVQTYKEVPVNVKMRRPEWA